MSYRLVMIVGLLGCGGGGDRKVARPTSNDPPAGALSNESPGPTNSDSPAKEGGPCAPTGTIADEVFNPIDMNREASVMSAAGHRIFVCDPVIPAKSGLVVDETTRTPLAGAVVTIEAWQARPPIGGLAPNRQLLKVVGVHTDDKGQWNAPESSIWLTGILAADGLPYVIRSYCVHADGHAPVVLDPWKPGARATDDSTSEIRLRAAVEHGAKPEGQLSPCGIPLGPPL